MNSWIESMENIRISIQHIVFITQQAIMRQTFCRELWNKIAIVAFPSLWLFWIDPKMLLSTHLHCF